MKDEITNLLENLYIYHLPLDKIAFDFEKKEVLFVISDVDWLTDIYHPLAILFKNVFSFRSEYPQRVEIKEPSCYGVACDKLPDGRYEVSWLFVLDDQPLWEVRIGFESLEIKGGLSPEAIVYRDKVLAEG